MKSIDHETPFENESDILDEDLSEAFEETEDELDEQVGQDETTSALMENLKAMVLERDEAREAMVRTLADFQNFRRRAEQEKAALRRMAAEQLVHKLIPVLDNFDRTIAALEAGATVDSVMEGVRGIDRQLRAALESVELKKEESVGKTFDPEIHEAVGTHDDPELPENTVTHELEAGYRMAGNVVRPAKVRVSRKP